MQIGICDDEIGARQTLAGKLERSLIAQGQDCTFFDFSSGEGLLRWLEQHTGELDVLFLDIEMGGINGMETARKIRETDNSLILVFVTGFADYVFDGYSVGALGYLTKPVKPERLETVLKTINATLLRQSEQSFSFSSRDGKFRVGYEQILYFYSDRRQVVVVTTQKEYPFYGKLDEVEKEVGSAFVRIHQSYLVRGTAVTGLTEGAVTLRNGAELAISRKYRGSAMTEISRAILTKGGAC